MIRFFDMFSSIGGFRAGLELANSYTCNGCCEIDKHDDKTYRAAHKAVVGATGARMEAAV